VTRIDPVDRERGDACEHRAQTYAPAHQRWVTPRSNSA
jgi:hypothetical protein